MNNQYQPTRSSPPPLPQHQPTEDKDARVGLIKSIWGCATGMLGICIPLIHVLHGHHLAPLLPVCVIAGATLGTIAVLTGMKGPAPKLRESSSSEAALQEHVRQLEERLANVETISSFERGLHERELLRGHEDNKAALQERDSLNARSVVDNSY